MTRNTGSGPKRATVRRGGNQAPTGNTATLLAPEKPQDPQTITIVTRDNIRTLLPHTNATVTAKKAANWSLVVDVGEIDRVKQRDLHLTKEDSERRSKATNAANEAAAEAARARKAALETHDAKRALKAPLSDIEESVREQNNYLLSKAVRQLEEQEDDIKHMNELMMYVKCVAIRDLQVKEKQAISEQKKAEETRLDVMMEADRVSALRTMREREEAREAELRKGAGVIRQQIREREIAKVLEQERRDQEVKQLLKSIEQKAEQDQKDRADKIVAQRALMEEVVKANQESIERKRRDKQAALDEDHRIMQYLLEKADREAQAERDAQQRQAEREKELGRLRALQQKLADKAAEQDALRAQRAHEAYEREWRRKEKLAAENHARMEQELREERARQQRARDFAIAAEAHQMRKEFYDNLQHQKERKDELERLRAEKQHRNLEYFYDLKKQIHEKEEVRAKERQAFFSEGVELQKQQEEKKAKLGVIKQRKLHELEQLGIPTSYIKEVERRVYGTRRHLEA